MLFTLVVQLIIMRRLEKMLGWLRVIIIYTVCGMTANVFSAIFIPYFVTVSCLRPYYHTRWSKKTDTQFYFWDNFGNSAPI